MAARSAEKITSASLRASVWMSDDGKTWHRGTLDGTACGVELEGEMGVTGDMVPRDLLCARCLEGITDGRA